MAASDYYGSEVQCEESYLCWLMPCHTVCFNFDTCAVHLGMRHTQYMLDDGGISMWAPVLLCTILLCLWCTQGQTWDTGADFGFAAHSHIT